MSEPGASCAVVELRQYTLRPGRRDALVDLFDRELLEPQEDAGMRVVGQFRDLDDPDRFVWLRAFGDMESRRRSLAEFYEGPVWARHREAANATMVDSDDVLLLRPTGDRRALERAPARPATGTAVRPAPTLVAVTIYPLAPGVADGFARFFEERMRPLLLEAGAFPLACLRTEPAANTYPRLPVRTDEDVFCWLATFQTDELERRHLTDLARSEAWSGEVLPELEHFLSGPVRRLRLRPTWRSSFGWPGGAHDFDFVAGRWSVVNRRLRARGVSCDDWDEFGGTHRGRLLLGGIANVDEMVCPSRGFSGMSVRAFDPVARRWSISWVSSTRGVLEPPVFGGFGGDHGEFYGDDVDGGRPVQVRFRWDRPGPHTARWEQSFSYDGAPWERNWVMEFTREGGPPARA